MTYYKNIILFGIKSALISEKKLIESLSIRKLFENQNKISCQWSYKFYDRKISKLDSNHNCLAVISLDSTLQENNNYYRKMFLKECKYIEKNVFMHIHDNLSKFSYSSKESDEESIKNMNFWERNFENIYIFCGSNFESVLF